MKQSLKRCSFAAVVLTLLGAGMSLHSQAQTQVSTEKGMQLPHLRVLHPASLKMEMSASAVSPLKKISRASRDFATPSETPSPRARCRR